MLISIENIGGSSYNDILVGDKHDNILHGLGGADQLVGYDGNDTAVYETSDSGVTVDLQYGTGLGGHAQGDVLISIENIVGSAFTDILFGNEADNYLSANAGDDWLYGGNGNDFLKGGSGADYLFGGFGNDTVSYENSNLRVEVGLNGGTGAHGHASGDILSSIENLIGSRYNDVLTGNDADNFFNGGAGADTILGGGGIDTASYSLSDSSVTIDLARSAASGGHATGDELENIENITGSEFNDRITGDHNINLLSGGGGDDYIRGGKGDDRLIGGDGNDILVGGVGADSLDGGEGTDTASYSNSNSEITINLITVLCLVVMLQVTILLVLKVLSVLHLMIICIAGDSAAAFDGGDGSDTVTMQLQMLVFILIYFQDWMQKVISASGGFAEGDRLKNREYHRYTL